MTTPRRLPLLLVLFALPPAVSAHSVDEYLQATLVAVESGEIRLLVNLTPGTAVAERILVLIDRDHDGEISADEAAAYADLVKRDLVVRLDGRDLELSRAAATSPPPPDLRTGWGIVQMEFAAAPGPLAAGGHHLTFENRHLPAPGAYLLNATRPKSDAIQITGQRRNETQSAGEIEFTLRAPAKPAKTVGIAAPIAVSVLAVVAGIWLAWMRASRPVGVPRGRRG